MEEKKKQLPDRKIVERALRDIGLSSRQAKKLLSSNWRLIVGEEEAQNDEALELLERLQEKLQPTKNKL